MCLSTKTVNIERLAPSFVGRIVDLELTEETIRTHRRAINEAYLAHKVLIFPGQNITPRLFAEFGKIFGEPKIYHVIKLRHPDESTFISNQEETGRNQK